MNQKKDQPANRTESLVQEASRSAPPSRKLERVAVIAWTQLSHAAFQERWSSLWTPGSGSENSSEARFNQSPLIANRILLFVAPSQPHSDNSKSDTAAPPAHWQAMHASDWSYGQREALKRTHAQTLVLVDLDRVQSLDDLELFLHHAQTRPWVLAQDTQRQGSWRQRAERWVIDGFARLVTQSGTSVGSSPVQSLPRSAWQAVIDQGGTRFGFDHPLAALERVTIAREAMTEVHDDRSSGSLRQSGPLDVPISISERLASGRGWRGIITSLFALLLVARIAWRHRWFPASASSLANEAHTSDSNSSTSSANETRSTPSRRFGWQLLLAIAVVLGAIPFFFGNLGFALVEPDETRNVQIALEMYESGDYLLPTRHGNPYLDKPAMMFWLLSTSFACFGPSEWAARLPMAIAGWFTVLGVIVIGARRFGLAAASLGAIALMCCIGFVIVSRFVITDVLLTCSMTWAALSLHRGMLPDSNRKLWWSIAGVALGLGILTKGPVAPVLTVPPFLLWCWLEGRLNRRSIIELLWAAVPMLLVPLPWFIAVAIREPAQLEHFFWRHNIVRFTQAFNHQQPFWFYVPVVFAGMFPASLLLPSMMIGLFSRRSSLRRLRTADDGFLWLAAFTVIGFFSISSAKLPTYILPSVPLLALLAGRFLNRVLLSSAAQAGTLEQPYHRHLARWLPLQAGGVLAVLAIGAAIVETQLVEQLVTRDFVQWIAIAVAIATIGIAVVVAKGKFMAGWAAMGFAAPIIVGYIFLDVYPDGARARSYFPTALQELAQWRGEDWVKQLAASTNSTQQVSLPNASSPSMGSTLASDPTLSQEPAAQVPLVWFGRMGDTTRLHVPVHSDHQFSEDQVFQLCWYAMKQWLKGHPATAVVSIPRHSTMISSRMPFGFELEPLREGGTIYLLRPMPWWDEVKLDQWAERFEAQQSTLR